jgi:pimeloyl-ACP methyl ester carboxylesterase
MTVALVSATLLVFGFAALGAWTRLLTLRAERDFPPLGRYVAVQGVRLHYVERGPAVDSPGAVPIVLIHGAFSALQDFSVTVLDDLAKTHRVLAFDRPGHGYSERPGPPWVGTPDLHAALIHEAVASLGVTHPLVVGFSWGGTVALAYALKHPNDTAGLVMLAAPSHPWPAPIEREYFIPHGHCLDRCWSTRSSNRSGGCYLRAG